jgi:hypothetical protein
VYPQSKVKIRCQAGDVIGSFLDLDNGFCSYYINGRDLGLTVEFEHPNRLNKEEEESDSDSKYESAQSSIPSPPQKKMTGLGLYPAISLTTYQQALVNFGEKGWMYDPPTSTSFKGICEAGALDPTFSRRVMRWVQKRGVTSYKLPLRPKMGAEECQDQDDLSASPKSDASDDDDDWDGPLCTICFSEPKDTILMPCRHDGIGGRCAKLLTMW